VEKVSGIEELLIKYRPPRRKTIRKPIPSKLRREKMTKPRKCTWCRKLPAQELHHIDGNPKNNNPNNLIPLCGYCHERATAGEITKEQLRKRLGIKRKIKKVAKKKRVKTRRPKTPLEGYAKKVDKLVYG